MVRPSGKDTLTGLTLHRSYAGVLKEEPVVHLIPLAGALGIRDLVLGIVALNEVLHDASRLEQVDGLTISELVGQCRNTTIRVDGQEPILLLRVLADVDLLDLVGKTAIVNGWCLSNMTSGLTRAPLA